MLVSGSVLAMSVHSFPMVFRDVAPAGNIASIGFGNVLGLEWGFSNRSPGSPFLPSLLADIIPSCRRAELHRRGVAGTLSINIGSGRQIQSPSYADGSLLWGTSSS